jgi:hypothetical protein
MNASSTGCVWVACGSVRSTFPPSFSDTASTVSDKNRTLVFGLVSSLRILLLLRLSLRLVKFFTVVINLRKFLARM